MSRFRVEAPLSSRHGKTFVTPPLGFDSPHNGIPADFVCAQTRENTLRIFHTPSLERAYQVRDAWHAGWYAVAGDLRYLDLPPKVIHDHETNPVDTACSLSV